MSRSFVRWARRGAIAVAVLLVAGFAVGSLAGSKRNEAGLASVGPVEDGAARRNASGFTSTSAIGAPPVPAPAGEEQSDGGSSGPTGLLPGSDAHKALS